MPTWIITWQSQPDACKVCSALNGYSWTFQDQIPDSLEHPLLGVVWDFTTGSLAHGHTGKNCKCTVEAVLDITDFSASMQPIFNRLNEIAETEGNE